MSPVFSPGTVIDGRYEILGPLASGGMGHVYRARRVLLGDEVAIKVIRTVEHDFEAMRERFLRESRACAQLRHPNIVAILDYDVDEQHRPFLVMELLSGPSLKTRLAEGGRVDLAEVQELALDIGSAIQLAHDRGIVHRDLKPANIVCQCYQSGERVWKVIDFGLVSSRLAADDETELTSAHQFVGTVAYAAPEQLRGQDVDASADIYSAGALVYELLTGRPPFVHDDPLAIITAHLTTTPEPPSRHVPSLPTWVDAVVLRALAKRPADRWPTILDFVRALGGPRGGDTTTTTAELVVPALSGFIGRYELGPMIGRGRFGSEVYAARHRALGHPVAVRTLRRETTPHWEAACARLLREAQALQVSHPSVIQVRDYGEEGDVVYVVTELLDSVSLREALAKDGPVTWPRLQVFVRQLLSAAGALHRGGGLLCGLSPEIIRIQHDYDGERLMISSAGICQVHDLLGTLSEQTLRGARLDPEVHYVAPEVFMGVAPSPRSDVFTLGVLVYEMATGRLPYVASTMHGLVGAALTTTPRPPREMQAEIPERFSDGVLAALRGNAAERPADVIALQQALFD